MQKKQMFKFLVVFVENGIFEYFVTKDGLKTLGAN